MTASDDATAPAARSARRDQILETAAEMFAARGFHGVSVSDLGAACGISGPALYKHFPSKDAVLAEMLVSISRRLLEGGRDRVAAASDPQHALERLIAWHVEFALRHRSLIVVQDRDWESLPPTAREEVRTLQRAYVDLWAEQHHELVPPPDLGELGRRLGIVPPPGLDHSRAQVHAVFGLINSTPHSALLPYPDMERLLRDMAARALAIHDDGG